MARFTYKAKEGPGKLISGVIEANNNDHAVSKIIKLGLTPIDVQVENLNEADTVKSKKNLSIPIFQKVKLSDLVLFTRQMSDLVGAAVPILKALQIVNNQTSNPHLNSVIQSMYLFVKDGGSFSDALARNSTIFSPLYINMVRTGEASGQLELTLSRLAEYLEKQQETNSKVKASLAYPFVILGVGIITMFVLFTWIIPRLSEMFNDLDQELPLPTIILTNISEVFAQFWWLMLILIIGGVVYFKQYTSSENGRIWFDSLKLRLPIFGSFIKLVEVGRFSRTLGTLVESGVSITSALTSVWATINNVVLRSEVKSVSEEVANGSSIKAALSRCHFFPEMAVNMISVGEETGNLEHGLYKIADTYEREADRTIKTFISLLGPLVLVFIVVLVGFVVIAMLLPILQMNLVIE
ncbi:MAG: type II secretion system F family protein [Candidatus Omnitrophica bacterium]|nr:type II secretion system F family protein [Candidatus Omnitrophota bacterium]MCB9747405.1 type II secretion system F family protein [Candidatus Omnitrophota bacterium]